MRLVCTLWVATVLVILTTTSAGLDIVPDTAPTDNPRVTQPLPIELNSHNYPTVLQQDQDGNWILSPDPWNGANLSFLDLPSGDQRENLMMPFRSISEIPTGRFILGPHVPPEYRQHFGRAVRYPAYIDLSGERGTTDPREFYRQWDLPSD